MNKREGMYFGRELDPNYEELVVKDDGGDEGPSVEIIVYRCFSLREQEQAGCIGDFQEFYVDEMWEDATMDYDDVYPEWGVENVRPEDSDWPEGVPADAPVWPMRDTNTGFVWFD